MSDRPTGGAPGSGARRGQPPIGGAEAPLMRPRGRNIKPLVQRGAAGGARLEQFNALTSPLITTASGAKMGKTAAGAVWLDASMRPPYDDWQFWRNTEDANVGRFLKLFTLMPLDGIRRLESLRGAEINEAKKALANEATALLRGREAAEDAAETARKIFEEGALAESLPTVRRPSPNSRRAWADSFDQSNDWWRQKTRNRLAPQA